MAGKGVLIVCYSETGDTRRIAEDLAAALNASVERLETPGLPGGTWGFAVRLWQSLARARARIAEPRFDPADFGMVLVGSPVWAGRIASPLRAWLRRFGARVRTGAAFEERGAGRAARNGQADARARARSFVRFRRGAGKRSRPGQTP